MPMTSQDPDPLTSRVYNSVWQLRADAWVSLAEVTRRLITNPPPDPAPGQSGAGRPEPAGADLAAGLLQRAEELLHLLEPIENCWAFPGRAGLSELSRLHRLGDRKALAARTGELSRALISGSYRTGLQRVAGDAAGEAGEEPVTGPAARPYFEVLVVAEMETGEEEELREQLRRLRRPEDVFRYDLVVVPSFEDAVIAALVNFDVQAAVIGHWFANQSRHDLSVLHRFFHGTALLELHLSILQGVSERYRTPFFAALRDYSHRPTGVFHALPISRGASVATSHWIPEMADFYGMNIFLAESSATSGGLDSLLEPTGPLREAQELAARTFGSRHTFFVTNGTSTANKIVVQALIRPGDIVLVDRDCHKPASTLSTAAAPRWPRHASCWTGIAAANTGPATPSTAGTSAPHPPMPACSASGCSLTRTRPGSGSM